MNATSNNAGMKYILKCTNICEENVSWCVRKLNPNLIKSTHKENYRLQTEEMRGCVAKNVISKQLN